MIQIKILYIILFVLGINLVVNGNIEFSFSLTPQINNSSIDTKVQTNSLNLSKPIYQVTNSSFFATQNISSKPFPVTKEFDFAIGIMKNVGNVTQFNAKGMGQLKLWMVKQLIGYLLT
jgi:hypothetical protein